MNGPEVTRNFDLAFRTDVLEILVPEDNHLPFCDEQRKLIQPFLAELRDLHPFNFRPYIRAEVLCGDVGCEQVRLGGVCTESWVAEFKDFGRRKLLLHVEVGLIEGIRIALVYGESHQH